MAIPQKIEEVLQRCQAEIDGGRLMRARKTLQSLRGGVAGQKFWEVRLCYVRRVCELLLAEYVNHMTEKEWTFVYELQDFERITGPQFGLLDRIFTACMKGALPVQGDNDEPLEDEEII